MAGIEQLEIHSKSYIVRWVKVDEGHTISWSVQPHKKSINFGIVKHPGTGGTNFTTFQTDGDDTSTSSQGPTDGGTEAAKAGLFAKRDAGNAPEQLRKKGFKSVSWHGKCDADKVAMGTYDVPSGEGGMFGLVFDNTFSKQTSKNATFVLLTYPTGAPPQGTHHLPNMQTPPKQQQQQQQQQQPPLSNASRTSLGHTKGSESVDSLGSHGVAVNGSSDPAGSTAPANNSPSIRDSTLGAPESSNQTAASNYHVGTLLKRRRKKGQGYARRFFSLDYATCTLSYYYNRNSSALRGAIPLSLAAIAADERRREITIDSGAEIWHLKASNAKEFTDWALALERASRIARGLEKLPVPDQGPLANHRPPTRDAKLQVTPGSADIAASTQRPLDEDDHREWQQVETLVSRVVGTRDALRRLVKTTEIQPVSQHAHHPSVPVNVPGAVPEEDGEEHRDGETASLQGAQAGERRSFWRRKSIVSPMAPQNIQSTVGSSLAVPAPSTVPPVPAVPTELTNGKDHAHSHTHARTHKEDSIHNHCQELLDDLDTVVAEFTKLLATSKQRRRTAPVVEAPTSTSRRSLDSTTSTEEFFDAAEGEAAAERERERAHGEESAEGKTPVSAPQAQVMRIDAHSEADDTPGTDDGDEVHDESSASSVEDEDEYAAGEGGGAENLFPPKPKSLAPLPINEAVKRRTAIPAATVMPPSLIAFVRKNVGKDLSTISMPASANEPTSMLQRVAEQLEYAHLLNEAAAKTNPNERLLYVAAFAVSQFSGGRVKERSIRKPFNPLLGETFELLRSEQELPGGLRLLVEKVCHRPVRLVMQADSAAWSFAQAPAPSQKFWGKSAEITTEGRVRVVLRLPGGAEARYSWTLATVFLRNVVMGEKYVEPVGTMHVVDDCTGAKAAVEFRSKGMFGGRSEDVQVDALDAAGAPTGLSMTGTWTQSLRLVDNGSRGAEVWRVGPLVDDAPRVYGMTRFAASLNEITPLENGRLAPTDTRLRPDQRLAEEGNLDEAEVWKTRLEEAQRVRRRELEERGEQHRPRWFVKAADGPDGDEVWRLKTGKDSYWEERSRGTWTGVDDIFSG